MNVGVVKIAEDKDFEVLKSHLYSGEDEWSLEYDKKDTKVWTKASPEELTTNFKLIKVYLNSI